MAKERKYENEYQEYCNNLLKQLEEGGMNKLEDHLAKIKYKNSKAAYDDFVNLYEEKLDEDAGQEMDILFTPEESEQ